MKIYEGIIPKISQYTTLPIMDQVKIGYLRVAIPATIQEQELIADYLDNEMSKISKLEGNLSNQISTLEQYRKSLIHECVTGKRRITEEDMRVVQQY
jgi:type I restriction enzyme S subunit